MKHFLPSWSHTRCLFFMCLLSLKTNTDLHCFSYVYLHISACGYMPSQARMVIFPAAARVPDGRDSLDVDVGNWLPSLQSQMTSFSLLTSLSSSCPEPGESILQHLSTQGSITHTHTEFSQSLSEFCPIASSDELRPYLLSQMVSSVVLQPMNDKFCFQIRSDT